VQRKLDARLKERFIDALVAEQFGTQRLLVRLTSRPGQSGRADGYLLEGKELEFYVKKIESKKK
jgi:small subunit ribosomal protein S8e